jgi:hypothetical protein
MLHLMSDTLVQESRRWLLDVLSPARPETRQEAEDEHEEGEESHEDLTTPRFVELFSTVARALEAEKGCTVEVAGRRVKIPPDARYSVEYDRNRADEGIEFEITWPRRRHRVTSSVLRGMSWGFLGVVALGVGRAVLEEAREK